MTSFAARRKAHLALGKKGEDFAADHLKQHGFTIFARNWRTNAGELDIVAFDNDTLVFVEVKTAGKQRNFSPADNLSANQKKRNYNAAKVYMRSLDNCPYPGKFDLVEVFFRWNFIVKIRRTANYLPDLPVQSSYE